MVYIDKYALTTLNCKIFKLKRAFPGRMRREEFWKMVKGIEYDDTDQGSRFPSIEYTFWLHSNQTKKMYFSFEDIKICEL
jgi:hypothetical protein